ncbi:DoxX family protein [soil metagenome]
MAIFYIAAGINHFYNPGFYLPIMPLYIPFHLQLIYFTGIIEVLLGILLLFPGTRSLSAISIIIFLILVFPANIQMAVNNWDHSGWDFWIALLRLPVQILLVMWAYLFVDKKKRYEKVKLKDNPFTE